MAQINLLFLAPHWRVSLVRAFQRTRKTNQINATLIGADSNPNSSAQKALDPAYTIPEFSSANCLERVLSICRKENVNAILPMINLAVEFLDLNRDEFEKTGIKLLLNHGEAIRICHDKRNLELFCRQNGIATPEIFESSNEGLHFPLFAKEQRGEGGKNSMVLENLHDLEYCQRKYPNHIIQRFIRGREFSIDWFSDLNGRLRVLVPRERLLVRSGEVMLSRVCLHPVVIKTASLVGKALSLQGPCTIQGFLDHQGEKFFLTDVNLRFGSGYVHTIAAGADIPLYLYKELIGEKVPAIDPIENGLMMTRFNDEFYYKVDST